MARTAHGAGGPGPAGARARRALGAARPRPRPSLPATEGSAHIGVDSEAGRGEAGRAGRALAGADGRSGRARPGPTRARGARSVQRGPASHGAAAPPCRWPRARRASPWANAPSRVAFTVPNFPRSSFEEPDSPDSECLPQCLPSLGQHYSSSRRDFRLGCRRALGPLCQRRSAADRHGHGHDRHSDSDAHSQLARRRPRIGPCQQVLPERRCTD